MKNSFYVSILLSLVSIPSAFSETPSSTNSSISTRAETATAPPPSSTALADPSIFTEADQLFRERRDEKKGRLSLEKFREFYKKYPSDPQAAWRVGMGCYFVGIRLTSDDETKKKLFAEGRDAAYAGVKLNSKCTQCHFWGAINQALYGDTVGPFKMLFSLKEIQEHLRESLLTDATYMGAGAYRLLGMIDYKLPGILGGSNKRAQESFEKAIQNGPEEPLNYLFLARLLVDEDQREKALEIAKKGLAVPPPGPERIEAQDAMKDLEAFVLDTESHKK